MGVANAVVKQQDASQVWDARDGYDAIAFTGAMPSIPEYYLNKMNTGGRLFAILGEPSKPTMEATLVTRVRESEWSRESLFETCVDSLVNFESETPSFVF
jgi:protein-L-isoaspartate(D-aspartate) O-methyltransferase